MKKLKLDSLNLDIFNKSKLTSDQMKKIYGGDGPTSGSGSTICQGTPNTTNTTDPLTGEKKKDWDSCSDEDPTQG